MAIYHCNVQIISRSSGRSAIASAAYRGREKLTDDRTGKTHDYRKRGGLSHAEILAPDYVPERLKNRQQLWAEVEAKETRVNSQLAREFILALPKELSDEENIRLVRGYAKKEFVKQGMIADVCVHDLDKKNPHAHIMLTMRHADKDGLKNEKKSARSWNKKELLKAQRSAWSVHVNQALEKAQIAQRIDHRSWKDKGIEHEPEIHLGWYANNLEKQGVKTELGDLNRDIKKLNLLYKEMRQTEKEYAKAKAEQKQQERINDVISTSKNIARHHHTNKEAAKELKQSAIDEKALLKQLLDQQRDRERDKPCSNLRQRISLKNTEQGNPTLNQQLENLKNAVTEFSAATEKLGKTQQTRASDKPPTPQPKRYVDRNNQEWER